ncbi:MAG TPA: NAD-dependent epimerase/dehydratase family protein [Verrucomicrobiae bacterium]
MRVAVTGAFGYSGRYIVRHLLDQRHAVITLTNSLRRENQFGARVRAYAFNFDRPELLVESLRGIDALINTYWVRFDHRLFTHSEAVANTKVLFQAAKDAGVRRIIHVSITNPDIRSDLPYFSGKAELESALTSLGMSYCILRPAVLFGKEDVLINNIAWSLRYLPICGVFGAGDYKLQPIYVDDLAEIASRKIGDDQNEIINAIGPETFTYRELVETVRESLGVKTRIVGVSPELGYWGCRLLGFFLRDVIITREEIRGLMEGRLYVDSPSASTTKLSEWIDQHKETLGLNYTSEIARRVDRASRYKSN